MADENPVGRPSLYKPEYCDKLIEHMAKGLSFESFAGSVGVCRNTLYDWAKAHPEFDKAKDMALERARIFWEQLGITHILNESESTHGLGSSSRSLNSTVWMFNMKNRFGWRDKQPGEVDVSVNVFANKSDDELEARIQELMRKNGQST